jgi:hypothetical protein
VDATDNRKKETRRELSAEVNGGRKKVGKEKKRNIHTNGRKCEVKEE